MAAMSRTRSDLATLLSSLAAERLTRIKKCTADSAPIQHGVGRIAESVGRYREVAKTLKVPINCMTDDLGATTAQLTRGGVELLDHRIRQPYSHLGHEGSKVAGCHSNHRTRNESRLGDRAFH